MKTNAILAQIIDTGFDAEGYKTLLKYEMALRDMWVRQEDQEDRIELVLQHCLNKQALILSLLF